jgi:hypothetical protein
MLMDNAHTITQITFSVTWVLPDSPVDWSVRNNRTTIVSGHAFDFGGTLRNRIHDFWKPYARGWSRKIDVEVK